MGAVFALFAAWYFWSPKTEGLTYNDRKGRLHFWGLFIGVMKILALNIVYLYKILFDTRKNFIIFKRMNLSYNRDNYSVNVLFLFMFMFILKFFTLITNYSNARLVEVKNSVSIITDIQKASQRFNTKDIQWFVGFTDGDGCLTMYKEKKRLNSWRHEFIIGLSIKDIRLLYKIKKIVGCGVIRKYNNVAIFRVKKIKHLIYNIIPIFDRYPLLTDKKRMVYLNFRYTLLNKVLVNKRGINHEDSIFVKQLLNKVPNYLYNISIEDLFKNIDNSFFENWLVGFTEAEGSFYFIKKTVSQLDNISKPEIPLRAEFRISQNNNYFLLSKIKEKLKLYRKVDLQSGSSNHYYLVAVSSLSLQNVVNFYTNPNLVKFKGIKYLQFVLWLKGIKNIVRHNKIKVPVNYGGDSS